MLIQSKGRSVILLVGAKHISFNAREPVEIPDAEAEKLLAIYSDYIMQVAPPPRKKKVVTETAKKVIVDEPKQ